MKSTYLFMSGYIAVILVLSLCLPPDIRWYYFGACLTTAVLCTGFLHIAMYILQDTLEAFVKLRKNSEKMWSKEDKHA